MLSVVITAWNEEENIGRAISSVKKIADEVVVVVDKSTTDKTADVAKKMGAKVHWHVHTGIVEPMRNFSISKARGDWILVLDADEEIPVSLVGEIQKIVSHPQADYYRLPRKDIIFGKWIKSQHWWPDYVYRLFKKGSVTWDDAIHSIPFTRGKGADLPPDETHAIIHHHYTSISQYVDRLNRYTDHQIQHPIGSGYSFSWTDLITKPISEFLNQFFARQGYKEGVHGLALSGLQMFSELVLYLKLWQHSQFVTSEISVDEITHQLTLKAREYHWWATQARIDRAPLFLKPFYKIVRRLGL